MKAKAIDCKAAGVSISSTMKYYEFGDKVAVNLLENKIYVSDSKYISGKIFEFTINPNDKPVVVNGVVIYSTIIDGIQKVILRVKDQVLHTFTDKPLSSDTTGTFLRVIDGTSREYYYSENNLVLKKQSRKVEFLAPIKKTLYLNKKYLVMDIETKLINNIFTPVCISIFDGLTSKSFLVMDYDNNTKTLFLNAFEYLKDPAYDNYRVYLHNFSKFDGIFMFCEMTEIFDEIDPRIRDDNFINIKVKYSSSLRKKPYHFIFRDSLLILPLPKDKENSHHTDSSFQQKV